MRSFQEDEVLGVTELSRRLELHKNNVFRLLATLEHSGYVEQCEDDRYRLGTACLELGHAFSRTRSLARQARPILEELCATTGETIHLGVLSDFDVVHVDGEQPDQLVVTRLRKGGRLPAHCTALGKMLLGSLAPQALEQIDKNHLGAGALIGETPTTITDRDKFIEHLRGVRAQGWAIDLEECEPGLCCVAAPVHDENGIVIAALSLSAPTFRASEAVMVDRVAAQVVEAGDRLSRLLGWTGAS